MARRSPKHRVITPAAIVKQKRIPHSKIAKVRDKLAKKQDWVCPICGRNLKRLIVTLDHCHKTGYIRGALCNNCNGLEGKLNGIIARLDVGKIGFDEIIQRLAAYRAPKNLKKKWIHPHAETLLEQRERQRKRANELARKRRAKK